MKRLFGFGFSALPRGPRTARLSRQGAGAAPFAGIRSRLTLWYSAVLAVALMLFGTALYAGIHQALFAPVDSSLNKRALGLSARWQGCPSLLCRGLIPGFGGPQQILAVFDAKGNALRASPIASVLPTFMAPSLTKMAVHNGSVFDTVAGGSAIGMIRRLAVAVPNPTGPGVLGVVQVGALVQQEVDAQQGFLIQLLTVGALTLVVATLGGLFLAHRALAPARLAFARQQRFIADASHELRTPLTLLRADAEVLLRGRNRLPPDDAALLEDIVSETAHMTVLAGNMLTMARLDAGRFHLERDVVDLAAVAATLVRRGSALAAETGVALYVDAAQPALVIGDRALLEQAALILLDNAIKYNRPGGGVTVRTHLDGGHAYLTIRDTGIGITPEHLARLGEPFYRVDKARSREAGGAGLGIAIAREIASAHDGALTLTSQPEQGTAAMLTFPAARIHAGVAPAPA